MILQNQEAVLDDDTLEKLNAFEPDIGGGAYARRRAGQLWIYSL